ncbi:hypothetical protein [Novilysobacter spongiicola]|uniref:LPP20 lipoprotein n=1 Tax=Lysobacter spongiicola DSM 21749 TaxID=1122188 RepID=A0A1T4NC40_9GAMM|nr:hypothetical protein [Lysobacter spongiicola]SJZ76607.1 hypothetical protein SAMN02745674_00819 [Lysobacter spongiicola DSM 21749]
MQMTFRLRIAVCVLAALCALPALAQVVSSKGMATVSYSGRLSPDERQEAMRRATLSALESHVAETWVAKAKVFASRREEFGARLDQFVLGSTVLNESEDKKANTYTVVVRAEVNATLLRAELDAGSATATASMGDRSLVTALFVARMQDSVQTFRARDYHRADVKASGDASGSFSERTREGESIGGGSIGTSGSITQQASSNASSSVTTETGGSVTQRADNVAWKVTNAGEINTAMTGVFSGAGYEMVEAEYVEAESGGQLSVERVRSDFSAGDDLSPEVLRSTVAGVRTAGIPYLAFGTLDVGMRDTDPVSGNVRVYVTVTGKVLDVRGRFPRTISSVGPVQFAGLGRSEMEARTNALSIAAERTAQTMVDELNVRAVH